MTAALRSVRGHAETGAPERGAVPSGVGRGDHGAVAAWPQASLADPAGEPDRVRALRTGPLERLDRAVAPAAGQGAPIVTRTRAASLSV